MGWEFHNRPRDDSGRWTRKHATKLVSLHFNMRKEVYDELRRKANDNRQSMTDYVEAALQQRWQRDRNPVLNCLTGPHGNH